MIMTNNDTKDSSEFKYENLKRNTDKKDDSKDANEDNGVLVKENKIKDCLRTNLIIIKKESFLVAKGM